MSSVEDLDKRAKKIIDDHTWAAAGAMVAIPVPGVDMAATFAVWGKMVLELAKVYHSEPSLHDARRLASDLFKGVVTTSLAWFGSAKLATAILKFIPIAGTVPAYFIDAGIAALGAKKTTAGVGVAAAAYYKSGKTLAPETLLEHVKNVVGDADLVLGVLASVIPAFPDKDKGG